MISNDNHFSMNVVPGFMLIILDFIFELSILVYSICMSFVFAYRKYVIGELILYDVPGFPLLQ